MSYINSIEHSIVITDISYTEVTQVISTLKKSSAGWDELPTFVAKKCISGYIEPLTYLINTSFTEGVFPKELKLARVVPIFKIGDKTELTNYRPISVLSFFSKVFEKIMYTHLLDFIEQNKIIYKHQYGFRQKHSTQHAIITLVDRITNSLDKGDIVISIFLDLKKAFDTVDHPTLLMVYHNLVTEMQAAVAIISVSRSIHLKLSFHCHVMYIFPKYFMYVCIYFQNKGIRIRIRIRIRYTW